MDSHVQTRLADNPTILEPSKLSSRSEQTSKPNVWEKRWVDQKCLVHVITVTATPLNYVNLNKEFDFLSVLDAQTQVGLLKLLLE